MFFEVFNPYEYFRQHYYENKKSILLAYIDEYVSAAITDS